MASPEPHLCSSRCSLDAPVPEMSVSVRKVSPPSAAMILFIAALSAAAVDDTLGEVGLEALIGAEDIVTASRLTFSA